MQFFGNFALLYAIVSSQFVLLVKFRYRSIEYGALYLIVKNKYRLTLLRGLKMGIYVLKSEISIYRFFAKTNFFVEKTVIIFVISTLELIIAQVLDQVAKKLSRKSLVFSFFWTISNWYIFSFYNKINK